mmetsp:Transcript_26453/g.70194  ORF Transcript_26453/g.70194 Transcript_26453/m.70194 type:complete len:439 (-) Transcript_26453:947-2263(-)
MLPDVLHAGHAVELLRGLVRNQQQARLEARIPRMDALEQVLHLAPRRNARAHEEHLVRVLAREVEAGRAAGVALRHARDDGLEVAHGVVAVLHLVRVGQASPLAMKDTPCIVVVLQQLLVPHLLEACGDDVGHVGEARRPGQVEGVARAVELDLVHQHADRAPVAQGQHGHPLDRAQGPDALELERGPGGHLHPRLQAMHRDHGGAEWLPGAVFVDPLGHAPRRDSDVVPHRMHVVLAVGLVEQVERAGAPAQEHTDLGVIIDLLDLSVVEHIVRPAQNNAAASGHRRARAGRDPPRGVERDRGESLLGALPGRREVEASSERPGRLPASRREGLLQRVPAAVELVAVLSGVDDDELGAAGHGADLKATSIAEDDALFAEACPALGELSFDCGGIKEGEVGGREESAVPLRVGMCRIVAQALGPSSLLTRRGNCVVPI